MISFSFLDLLKARIGKKVFVKLKCRDYAWALDDVVGDMCVFVMDSTVHYVHYTQVSFYCNKRDCESLETDAAKIAKGE